MMMSQPRMKKHPQTWLWLVLLCAALAVTAAVARRAGRQRSSTADLKGIIPWGTDWKSAGQEAIASHKPLLVEFVADWCPDCHVMAAQTWTQPPVAAALQAYVPVLIDIDAHPDLSHQFNIVSIPSILVIDPVSGKVLLDRRDHIFSPDELLAWLKRGS
jgi:thiol:disulfide interchange protein